MKKCYYFPTWVDISDNVCISCNEKSIYVQPKELFVTKGDAIISLSHNDLVKCDTRYEDDAISNNCLNISKVHRTYTINGFKYEEDSLTPIASNTLGPAKRFTESTPSDPILAKLCELTGAKMYGDYVVLDKIDLYSLYTLWNKYDRFSGDLIEMDSREFGCGCNQKFEHCKGCLKLCNKILEKNWSDSDSNYYTNETICNVLEEYSKFLRNEESKWEEVKKIVL